MKLDWNARKDFVRDVWRMFVLYAHRVDIQYHERIVVITVHTKEQVEVDGVKYMVVNDWNRYTEVPSSTESASQETSVSESPPQT